MTKRAYLATVSGIFAVWAIYMTVTYRWGLFEDLWGMSATMLFGSIIAGATPQGGAAVAFPVFTKYFELPASDARTFGLMIQSVGMGMATFTFALNGVQMIKRVLLWVSLGGVIGMMMGTYVVNIPDPYPRLLFTFSLTVFAAVLIVSRWIIKWAPRNDLPDWNHKPLLLFLSVGVIGGIFASYTGSGADTLTFVVLTLMFGVNEKISTPTTVAIMAVNSMVGFFLHAFISKDIGNAWNYWLVCVPIVIVGAPLGAYLLSIIKRDTLIFVVLILISAETLSTIILTDFTSTLVASTITAMTISGLCFYVMLYYHRRYILSECENHFAF